VLTKVDSAFRQGSGRLELAEKLFTDGGALAARVIVNRAWGWHFGRPLVDTPSDFGAQGDKPSHPQLLEDLAHGPPGARVEQLEIEHTTPEGRTAGFTVR
jgi:hypothetical protein